MLFLSLPLFIFFILAATGSLSGIGIVSYILLIEHGEKSLAESILFYALVAVIMLIIITCSLIAFSRRRVKNMEKIVEMARINGILAEERFKEFGKLGASLKILYHEILDVSERRAARIYLLNNVEDTLLGLIDEPVLIIDATGKITHATQKYISQITEEGLHIIGSYIADIYPNLDLKSVILEAQKTHSSVAFNLDKINAIFYPVHSKNNTIDTFCVIFGKSGFFLLPGIKKKETDIDKKNKDKKAFFGFFAKKTKKENKKGPETEAEKLK